MADPVASVETIVRIALAISEAVGTAQRNIDQCKDVQTQVSIAWDSLLSCRGRGWRKRAPRWAVRWAT